MHHAVEPFLAAELEAARVSKETHELALHAWHVCRREGLPVPVGTVTDGGEVYYCWDNGNHHMSVTVLGDVATWFYYDRSAIDPNDMWLADSHTYEVPYGFTAHAAKLKGLPSWTPPKTSSQTPT